jgi:hypothetical protein
MEPSCEAVTVEESSDDGAADWPHSPLMEEGAPDNTVHGTSVGARCAASAMEAESMWNSSSMSSSPRSNASLLSASQACVCILSASLVSDIACVSRSNVSRSNASPATLKSLGIACCMAGLGATSYYKQISKILSSTSSVYIITMSCLVWALEECSITAALKAYDGSSP